MSLLQQAIDFRHAFNQGFQLDNKEDLDKDLNVINMQANLVAEESEEAHGAAWDLMNAMDRRRHKIEENIEEKRKELLKELADTVFVCYQLAAYLGMDLDEAMKRVFESNMSKLGDDGKPIYREDGKILKGPNYKKPDLTGLV